MEAFAFRFALGYLAGLLLVIAILQVARRSPRLSSFGLAILALGCETGMLSAATPYFGTKASAAVPLADASEATHRAFLDPLSDIIQRWDQPAQVGFSVFCVLMLAVVAVKILNSIQILFKGYPPPEPPSPPDCENEYNLTGACLNSPGCKTRGECNTTVNNWPGTNRQFDCQPKPGCQDAGPKMGCR